jgi:hypothetical protein
VNTPRHNRILEALICGWIVAAQIWYYAQFKDVFRSAAGPLLRRLWR